jgi:hypothetical protein
MKSFRKQIRGYETRTIVRTLLFQIFIGFIHCMWVVHFNFL